MSGKVSDEMLMAYVDGELDGATAAGVARLIEADPDVARRAEEMRLTRRLAREVFAPLRNDPAPDRLVRHVLAFGGDGEGGRDPGRPDGSDNVVAFPMRRRVLTMLPLAACLAVAFGLGGYWLGAGGSGGGLLDDPALAEAVGTAPSGEERMIAGATVRPTATYRVADGLCRTFEARVEGRRGAQGVACDHGQGWTLELAIAAAATDGGYAPASAAATGSIDALLDALAAEGPLTPAEEAEALDAIR